MLFLLNILFKKFLFFYKIQNILQKHLTNQIQTSLIYSFINIIFYLYAPPIFYCESEGLDDVEEHSEKEDLYNDQKKILKYLLVITFFSALIVLSYFLYTIDLDYNSELESGSESESEIEDLSPQSLQEKKLDFIKKKKVVISAINKKRIIQQIKDSRAPKSCPDALSEKKLHEFWSQISKIRRRKKIYKPLRDLRFEKWKDPYGNLISTTLDPKKKKQLLGKSYQNYLNNTIPLNKNLNTPFYFPNKTYQQTFLRVSKTDPKVIVYFKNKKSLRRFYLEFKDDFF